MIKTILFDNNGVLTTCDDNKTIPEMAKYLQTDVEKLREIFHHEVIPADLGEITTEEFLRRIAKRLDRPQEWPQLRTILFASYRLIPEMQDLVKNLAQKYEVALLTNFIDCYDVLNAKAW